MMRGLHTGPAEPSRRVHGGRSWAGTAEGSSLAPHSPIPATPTANAPQGWKKFTWHNQHCTDLARRRLASKGRPEKQGWREAEAAAAGHISSLGTGRSVEVSVQGDLGRGGTKQPNNGGGVGLGLLTSHRLRVTPQNQNPGNKKRRV